MASAAGRRILGLPRTAFLAASAAVVVARAAVAVALTVSSGDEPNAAAGPPPSRSSSTTAGETTTAALLSGFSGTYTVVRTITSSPPGAPEPVGTTSESIWTVTSSCSSGPCDVTAVSSRGLTYEFTYAVGVWQATIAEDLPCFDQLGPTGETVPSTDMLTVVPDANSGSSADAPLASLTGTTIETIEPGCSGQDPGGRFKLALLLTRTGD